MKILRRRIMTEDEFLDVVADIYRDGGYGVMTNCGMVIQEMPRDCIERRLATTPYLEGGSGRHCAAEEAA